MPDLSSKAISAMIGGFGGALVQRLLGFDSPEIGMGIGALCGVFLDNYPPFKQLVQLAKSFIPPQQQVAMG